jgi:hypothetical protein
MSSGVRDEVRVIARITPAQLTTTSAASVGSTGGLGPDQTQPRCSSVSTVGPFSPAVEERGEAGRKPGRRRGWDRTGNDGRTRTRCRRSHRRLECAYADF